MTENRLSDADISRENSQQLTPELIKKVTDKVYALFLKDLKQENERRRIYNPHYRR